MDIFFSSVIGHNKVKKFLDNSINSGRIAHAYLFCGPANVGKSKTAECFAAALLNYKMPSEEGAEEFQFLKNNPDFIFIERGVNEKTGKLGQKVAIEQIREVNNRIQSTSMLGGRKVVVIKDADLMTLEAANAFLKNLEEPRGNAVIILLSGNPDGLPQTIVSRCQVVRFYPVPAIEMKRVFLESGIKAEKAELAIVLSGTRPGLALQLLRDKELFDYYKKQIDTFLDFFNLPLSERLARIREMTNEKEVDPVRQSGYGHDLTSELGTVSKTTNKGINQQYKLSNGVDKLREKLYNNLSVWMAAARALMHESFNLPAQILTADKRLADFKKNYSAAQTAEFLEKLHLAVAQLKANVNPKLTLENLMINL